MTIADSYALPAKLNLSAAGPLARDLVGLRGKALTLDASNVTHLGTPGLQVLISAQKTWRADGQTLQLEHFGASLAEQLVPLGLTVDQFFFEADPNAVSPIGATKDAPADTEDLDLSPLEDPVQPESEPDEPAETSDIVAVAQGNDASPKLAIDALDANALTPEQPTTDATSADEAAAAPDDEAPNGTDIRSEP